MNNKKCLHCCFGACEIPLSQECDGFDLSCSGYKSTEQIKRYRVIEDLQGGDFGMYRDYTVEQWREKAIEWATMDDNDDVVDRLNKLPSEQVLDYIADFWQIVFAEVDDKQSNSNDDLPFTVVKLKNLNATIYIDKWNDVSGFKNGKVRVYDSYHNYLSYYELDTVIRLAEQDGVSEQQWLDEEAKDLAEISDINKLLDCLGVESFTVAKKGDLSPIIKNFAESYDYDNQLTDMGYDRQLDWLRQNEWIIIIGDYVIQVIE